VGTNTQQKTQVHAQSSNIGTSLAAHPEDTQVAVIVKLNQLALVDGSDTQLSLDGRDQRRALEQGTGEGLEGSGELGLAARQLVMETNDGNILLSSSLLGLDQSSRSVDADNQTSRDLGVEGTTVTGLLNTNDFAPQMAFVSSMIHFFGTAIGIPISCKESAGQYEPKNPLNPGHNLVTGRVGGLVQVDDTGANVGLEVALQRRRSIGDRGEVAGSHKN
jgi:hypothetical protein